MSRITFGGLASGLDSNHLIDQLLELQGQPIRRKEKQIEELKVKQDTWRDVNMRLRHLRETVRKLTDKNFFLEKHAHSSDPAVVSAAVKNTAEDALYEVVVGQLATHHRVISGSRVEDLGLGAETVHDALGLQGSFAFLKSSAHDSGEDEEIVIEVVQSDSLSTLRNKINASGAALEASLIDGHLILKSTVSGKDGEIRVSDEDDILLSLDILDAEENYSDEVAAQNAFFNINGVNVERSSNTVEDLIDGVTLLLESAAPEQVVRLQVAADVEPAAEAFYAFVEQYNSVNDFLREKLDEEGQLQGDTTLMRVQGQLRSLLSQPVQDYGRMTEEGWEQKKYYALASLGITTLDKEGYLQFNQEQLAAAMRDDPEAVFNVLKFEFKDEYGRGTGEYGGVAVELDNYMQRLLNSTLDERGRTMQPITVQQEQSIQRRIDDIFRRIERREEQLLRYEERLIREFTALEKMISSLNSQSEEMARMIDQLPGFGDRKQ